MWQDAFVYAITICSKQKIPTPDRPPDNRPDRQPGVQPEANQKSDKTHNSNMPFHFWSKQTDLAELKTRVRRLETGRRNLATLKDVVKHWNDMATGNEMMQRIGAQERWQKNTDDVLLDLMKEVTIIEWRLNRMCPLGSDFDAISERTTSGSGQLIRTIAQEPASPNESSSPVSPLSLPSTFTKRKGDGIERMALDTNGLRLSRPVKSAQKEQTAGQ